MLGLNFSMCGPDGQVPSERKSVPNLKMGNTRLLVNIGILKAQRPASATQRHRYQSLSAVQAGHLSVSIAGRLLRHDDRYVRHMALDSLDEKALKEFERALLLQPIHQAPGTLTGMVR